MAMTMDDSGLLKFIGEEPSREWFIIKYHNNIYVPIFPRIMNLIILNMCSFRGEIVIIQSFTNSHVCSFYRADGENLVTPEKLLIGC